MISLKINALLLVSFFLFGCDNAEKVRIEDTTEKLAGTWLQSGTEVEQYRRVLSLSKDGKFVDRLSIQKSDSKTEKIELTGEWTYDGINLKRRFLSENGQKFSGGTLRYLTFQVISVTDKEIILKSKEALNINYLRVAEGTLP